MNEFNSSAKKYKIFNPINLILLIYKSLQFTGLQSYVLFYEEFNLNTVKNGLLIDIYINRADTLKIFIKNYQNNYYMNNNSSNNIFVIHKLCLIYIIARHI